MSGPDRIFRVTRHIVNNCECRHANDWREATDELDRVEQLLGEVVADYDRRAASRRGRALLWLLRRST